MIKQHPKTVCPRNKQLVQTTLHNLVRQTEVWGKPGSSYKEHIWNVSTNKETNLFIHGHTCQKCVLVIVQKRIIHRDYGGDIWINEGIHKTMVKYAKWEMKWKCLLCSCYIQVWDKTVRGLSSQTQLSTPWSWILTMGKERKMPLMLESTQGEVKEVTNCEMILVLVRIVRNL